MILGILCTGVMSSSASFWRPHSARDSLACRTGEGGREGKGRERGREGGKGRKEGVSEGGREGREGRRK